MRSLRRQRGLGWFGLLFVLAVVAFVAIVVVKTLPMYLNQMKVESALHKIAADPESGSADPVTIRKDLQKFWDIDDIEYLSVGDVKVKRTERGRFLSYDYETRERLFYNIYIVIHFADDVALANVQS
ncbi:MAG: DUF4845 domain-containing protein [Solimonas sp.]